jgi:hypothetical protein
MNDYVPRALQHHATLGGEPATLCNAAELRKHLSTRGAKCCTRCTDYGDRLSG